MGRWAAIATVALALAGAAVVLAVRAGTTASVSRAGSFIPLGATNLPASPRPALRVGLPRLLDRRHTAIWAPVLRDTPATSGPGRGEVVEQVGTETPEGTQNLVLVLEERVVDGGTWARVRLPASSPAGKTGWLPRAALGALHLVDTQLRIDLSRLLLTLYVDGRPRFRAPVGVGRPETPTPSGLFYVRDKLTRYASPFYGPVAFGMSARSAVLTDWPAGGYIGIHGTNQPGLIPGRVSHGCVRLRNPDVLKLSRLLPVGTPVVVEG
jgi:hypothetical protein